NDIALGTASAASGGNSLALGAGATATNAYGVALGAGSVDSANNNTAGSVVAGNYVSLNFDNSANTLAGAVSVGSAGAYRQLTNVADGVAAHDAVTVEQLASVVTQTDAAITSINTQLTTIGAGTGTGTGTTTTGAQAVQYSTAAAPTTPTTVATNNATLVGAAASTVGLHNVGAGALTATSTDAVNGSQLYTTNTEVATLAANVGGVAVNSALGPASATGTETAAVGGGSQATGANTVALGSGATATGTNSVALGAGSSDGGQSNVVSVGSAGAERKLVNVAAGAVTAGSTDAVNGGQLYTVAQQSANAVQYGANADGSRSNTVALVGGNAAAPVTMTNVAAGAVTATSTDAVNGSQLYGVSQTATAAQTAAASAVTLAQNSMQYDDTTHTSATLNSGGAATTLHNVAAGTALTDAANVGQVNAAMTSAVTQANAYTNTMFNTAMNSIWKVKSEAYAATAGAMAAAGLPQAHGTGKTLVSMAVGAWEGQSAYAVGLSRMSANGVWVVKGSVSFNTQGQGGANVGVGFEF
ncbi:MAG: YadA-like family protein, partial [Caulobacteraceae bacterium]